MLDLLKAMSLPGVTIFFVAANLGIFAISVIFCWMLGCLYRSRRIFDYWEPLRTIEILAAIGSIFFNAGISVFGWWLWKSGFIVLQAAGIAAGIFDCLVMLLFMDFGMYIYIGLFTGHGSSRFSIGFITDMKQPIQSVCSFCIRLK